MNNGSQTKSAGVEIGVYTFGEIVQNPLTGIEINPQQRLKEIVEAAKLADQAGLDVFGVGEHHRLDFVASATSVILAAIAQATNRIKLTSATTVLSTVDPVRLYEEFATLDLLSNGRAEMMIGRGAFIESFPLFGFELKDYHDLFTEKLELLLQLNSHPVVTWNGRFRTPLKAAEISPRPIQPKLPIWIGVGSSHQSADRAGAIGTGMTLAILGGDLMDYKPLADIYRIAGNLAGHKGEELKVAVASHGYLAETSQQALDEFYPFYSSYFKGFLKSNQVTKMSKDLFTELAGPGKGLFVGSPQQIIEKILYQYELFGHQRMMLQMDIGGIPFSQVAKSIELLATEVAPVVRKHTGA